MRSPLSAPERFAERRGVELIPEERDALAYEVRRETFEALYPPASERPDAVLVWIGAGRSGAPPRSWVPLLRERRVVWLGPNRAGNRRSPLQRLQLALDAAHHAHRTYPGVRCFVGGFSGGARIASELALLYPDVFAGGLFVAAADYFRPVRSSDSRWSFWGPSFPAPPGPLLAAAQAKGRYVLVTGTRDSNRRLVVDIQHALVSDGFNEAHLLDIPDLGHALPGPESIDQALFLLFGSRLPASTTGIPD